MVPLFIFIYSTLKCPERDFYIKIWYQNRRNFPISNIKIKESLLKNGNI